PEPEVTRLLGLLGRNVVPELGRWREDRTEDIAGARDGMSAQEVVEKLVDHRHVETSGAGLRNELHDGGKACHFEVRGRSLAGRPTVTGAHPSVQRQELLMSEDEVMLEVAFALLADGHRVLGLSGSEFVAEVEEKWAKTSQEQVRAVAEGVCRNYLG